jgi:hypothetical protein
MLVPVVIASALLWCLGPPNGAEAVTGASALLVVSTSLVAWSFAYRWFLSFYLPREDIQTRVYAGMLASMTFVALGVLLFAVWRGANFFAVAAEREDWMTWFRERRFFSAIITGMLAGAFLYKIDHPLTMKLGRWRWFFISMTIVTIGAFFSYTPRLF